jgi:hypothetical protein
MIFWMRIGYTTEKTGRCPERPLSSICLFDFALAAYVGFPEGFSMWAAARRWRP